MWLGERGWRGQGGSGVRIREGRRETQRGRMRMGLSETAEEADEVEAKTKRSRVAFTVEL